jgi:hypothetical protein
MTIIARCVDNDDATMIASLALLPPSRCCLPCNAALLASLVSSCPLQRFLACVPRVSRNVSSCRQVPRTITLPPMRCRVLVMTMTQAMNTGNEDRLTCPGMGGGCGR